jgi:hypothetical protein
MHAPLPLPWIDSLFARLTVSYGRAFLSQYEGIDIGAVKADWAEKLGGFHRLNAEHKAEAPAIAWALDNLVAGKPPTALEFRQLCRGYREPDHPLGLPAPPRPVPPKVQQAFAQLAVPLEDKRPERVRVAARYVAMWGVEGVKLSPLKQQILKDMRETVRQYEAQAQRETTWEAAHAAAAQ